MAEFEFVPARGGVIGTLPCGEKHWYPTEQEYNIAYYEELDEIVDEMARLDEARQAYLNMMDFDEWLKYA